MEYGKVPQYLDPNPNGELDNLYLDMNGIVHPCAHPENKPAPNTEDEMFLDIFKYTDRVLMMARPRKVLVIAVDGVAPRAKMNQQRSRRFRAAKDAEIQHEENLRMLQERGETIDDALRDKKKWDSNAITPGTPFMDGLAMALRYWVAYKLALDPGWKDLQVIISDATVPGEGEHKLMSFIRSQRLDPSYDPNTKHCIYGLDADLIFLGLATHEPHFRVLREDVFAQENRRLNAVQEYLMTKEEKAALDARDSKKPFLWLHVNVLREYLSAELYLNLSIWDLERAIDDWVFMCFFVGNDFLPHMPALSVRDNGIDILLRCWKSVMQQHKQFLTCDGKLNFEGVELLLMFLSKQEETLLKKKHEQELRYQARRQKYAGGRAEELIMRKQYLPQVSKGKEKAPLTADKSMPLMDTSGKMVDGYAQLSNSDIVQNRDIITKANMANADAAAALKKLLAEKAGEPTESGTEVSTGASTEADSVNDSASETGPQNANVKALGDDPDDTGDAVRLHESGYKDRYYRTKFHLETEEEVQQMRREVIHAYLEGISWVLLYYFQGCPSWQWFYPYHYAPFASDFFDLRDVVAEKPIKFDLGEPFRPYEQLMAVLPAASGHTLPEVFRGLMSDPDSEIIDFYPKDFLIDMNGATASWMGIALLPFIEQDRLLTAVQGKYPLLTEAEANRNTNKSAQLYISKDNTNYKKFLAARQSDEEILFRSYGSGLAGSIRAVDSFSEKGIFHFPLADGEMPDINNSAFLPSWYELPIHSAGKSMLLGGYIPHGDVLTDMDKDFVMNHDRFNPRFENNHLYVNTGPAGTKAYMAYRMRSGGYRSFLSGGPKPSRSGQLGQRNNYSNRGRNNQSFGSQGNRHGHDHSFRDSDPKRPRYGQGPNNGYNNGYNNNYNNGYNQGYNQNYNNQNYNNQNYNNQNYNNQNYNNQNYNNQGFNNNQGYNQNYNNNYNSGHRGNNGYNSHRSQGGYNSNYQNNNQNQGYRSNNQLNSQGRNSYR